MIGLAFFFLAGHDAVRGGVGPELLAERGPGRALPLRTAAVGFPGGSGELYTYLKPANG